mmetsp:Transcript_62954/g.187652  ORF Transcript_62954/g.187652 Transcript_62954/m.187652 type:complete len:204 (+) Transcript_62954:1015-1626(+)
MSEAVAGELRARGAAAGLHSREGRGRHSQHTGQDDAGPATSGQVGFLRRSDLAVRAGAIGPHPPAGPARPQSYPCRGAPAAALEVCGGLAEVGRWGGGGGARTPKDHGLWGQCRAWGEALRVRGGGPVHLQARGLPAQGHGSRAEAGLRVALHLRGGGPGAQGVPRGRREAVRQALPVFQVHADVPNPEGSRRACEVLPVKGW